MLLVGGYARLNEEERAVVVTVKTPVPQTREEVVETFRNKRVRDVRATVLGNPRDAVIEVQIGVKGVMDRAIPLSAGEPVADPTVQRAIEEYAKNLVQIARQVGQVLRN